MRSAIVWALVLGAWSGAAAQATFNPGDGRIAPGDILRRIRRELGEDLRPAVHRKRRTTPGKPATAASRAPLVRVTVRSGSGQSMSGFLRFPGGQVIVGGGHAALRMSVKLVREIRFRDWRARFRVRRGERVFVYFGPRSLEVRDRKGGFVRGRCPPNQWMRLRISMTRHGAGGFRRLFGYFRLPQGVHPPKKLPADVVTQIRIEDQEKGRALQTADRNGN